MRNGLSLLASLVLATLVLLTSVPMVAAAVDVDATAPATAPAYAPAAGNAVDELTALEDEVIRLVNEERIKNGVAPVRKSPVLTQITRSHSQDMLVNDFVSHKGSNGFSSAERALAAGYAPYGWGKAYVGENIAAGLHTPADAVRGWLNSPTHRANLLRPEYREIGVGLAKGGTYGTYWTQDFGSAPDAFPAFVNGGASRVTDPRVTLALTNETISAWGSMGPAVAVMVGTDPSFKGAAWQDFAGELGWTLTPTPGMKTLFVRLQDANGNTATSQVQVELQPAVAANSRS
ncbi:MAG: CAP domain-containing protein [Chloroflexota bacterium]